MRTFIFCICITISFLGFSQDSKVIDSLSQIVKTTTNDTLKMLTYDKLRRATSFADPKISQEYNAKFLEIAEKLNDSLYVAIGNFYAGNSYVAQSDFEKALDYYFISVKHFEALKDSLRLSSVLNGIGAAYEKNGNDSLSLKYFKQSQQISISRGDLKRSAIALNNISNIYKHRGDLAIAKDYSEKSVAQIKTTKQLHYIIPLSINLANIYLDLKEVNKSQELFEALLPQIDTVNNIYSYTAALRGLGNIHITNKNHKKGLEFLKHAFYKFEQSNFFDEYYELLPDLIRAYEINNQHPSALKLFYEYNSIKDSIFNSEKDKNLTEAIQKFETEKKDAQLKLLKVESEKKEQQKQLFLIIALAGVLIAGLLGFFSYKNKQKNVILAKQKLLLENTLDEKNVLLKEVHHRVKNSFQIVSSLLYLQSENLEDKEAKLAVKEAENRVRSMVLVHQKLYNHDELVGINTKDYFEDLVKDLFESHQFQKTPITYNLDVLPLVLDIETITPLGLILNELIINTLKHAFTNNESEGVIYISFSKEENALILKVKDNGKGFEGNIKQSSFGITLMKALSKKLNAHLNYHSINDKGTEAILKIKKFNILSEVKTD